MSCFITTVAVVAALLIPLVARDEQTPPGFSNYLVGFLTRGTAELAAGVNAQDLQKGHLANLTKMWEEGLLLASGPMADSGDLRGLLIFRSDAREAINTRLASDPLIKAGRLNVALKAMDGSVRHR